MADNTKEHIVESFSSSRSLVEVDIPERVDQAKLTRDDTDPQFVTLKVLEAGAHSRNPGSGEWSQEAVENVARQINEAGVEGGVGHLDPAQRRHGYTVPKIRWLGAVVEGRDLIAKGYVPPYADDLRTYLRNSEAAGARVGTSVYGLRERGAAGFESLELENIDIVHPRRTGLAEAAQPPVVTAESIETETEEVKMAEERSINGMDVVLELFNEAENASDVVREVSALRTSDDAGKALIAETLEVLGVEDRTGLVTRVRELVTEIAGFRAANTITELENYITEKADKATLLVPMLKGMVMSSDGRLLYESLEQSKVVVDTMLASDGIKSLKQAVIREAAGPNAAVGMGEATSEESEFEIIEYTPEQQRELAAAGGYAGAANASPGGNN